MKLTVAIALFGYTKALENVEGDGKTEVAQWVDADIRYKGQMDRICKSSYDCNTDQVCAGHMWEYNNQQESGKGCWHNSVCQDQSFYMFDGRMIQFFCDDEALKKFGGTYGSLEYPIWPSGEQHWDEYEETCEEHQDCRDRNGRSDQHCTDFIWEATEDGMSHSSGTSCYTWDRNYCNKQENEQTFAITNDNYGKTKFSAYTQLWCKGPDVNFYREGSTDAAADAAALAAGAAMAVGDWDNGDAVEGDVNWDNGDAAEGDVNWDKDDERDEREGRDNRDERDNRDGDRDGDREDGVDIRMGDNNLRMNEDDGVEIRTDGFTMRMSEDDEGRGRLEIVMGATKVAATVASAIVASTLY